MKQIDWIEELEKEQEEKEKLVDWLEEVKNNPPELFLEHFLKRLQYDSNKSSNWMDSVFKSLIKKQRS